MNRGSNPRRNRVTPFGTFEAVAARGTVMGNRGCLHDAAGEIRSRPFACRAWITCELEFRGRRRSLNVPGAYTHLFGLDEATMLAAGHRPCALCRRGAFNAFASSWCVAHGIASTSAEAIDAELHAARIDGDGRQITHQALFGELPDGATIMRPGSLDRVGLIWSGALHLWSHEGYGDPERIEPRQIVTVLTPRPIIRVLAAGYRPTVALSRPLAGVPRWEIADCTVHADVPPGSS